MGRLTHGTVISLEEAREVLRQKAVSLEGESSSVVIIERMHAYCLGEGTGVEFLMLLFVEPASEGVVPAALLRGLRECVGEREKDTVWDGPGLRASFARDVSSYVAALSAVQGYGAGLALLEPDPACGVDFFRGFLSTGLALPTVAYIVDQLRALAVLPASTPVKVAVAFSRRSIEGTGRRDEVAFSLHVVATTRTHARLVDVLRRRARLRRAKLRATISGHGAEEADWCDAVASLRSQWEGAFDEPPPGESLADADFLAPTLLLCHGQAGGFTEAAPGTGGALPFLARVAEVARPRA
jgi:hypothetical protein